MHFTPLTLSLIAFTTIVSADTHLPPHRRHLTNGSVKERHVPRYLIPRQRVNGMNDTVESSTLIQSTTIFPSSTSSLDTSSSSTSTAQGSGKVGDTIAPETVVSSTTTSDVATTSTETPTTDLSTSTEPTTTSTYSSPSISPSASPTLNVPTTIPVSSQSTQLVQQTTQRDYTSIITKTRTSSSLPSSDALESNGKEKSGGLSKTALIIIIVLSSVVGLGALFIFFIRKWKLGKSSRFDERLKPIDFSPSGGDGMEDVFLEKTLHRTMSNDMADKQRQEFVKELDSDPNYIAGIPEHDFTASANHAGYGAMGYDDHTYHSDPFAHAQAFEYDQSEYYAHPAHGNYPPPSAGHVDFPSHPVIDYPTQDTEAGYADLQRDNSDGSNHRPMSGGYTDRVSPGDFPSADQYIGRPTGGSDGPYAQAAQYRGY